MQKTLKYLKMIALGLLAAASAHAGSFSTDFSTDPSKILNFGGSLWDGVTTTGTGSANWQTNGGAGPFGNTTSNVAVTGVAGDGFLQLTFADHNCSSNLSSSLCGGVLFDDFDSGLVVAAFTFEADLRIGNGDPNPADGFSINYVRDNDPVLLALNAGDTFPQMNGAISPAGGQFEDNGSATDLSLMEEGTQTGLSIGFDMWDSGNLTIPAAPPAVGTEVAGITHDYIGLDIRVDGLLLTTVQMPNGTTGNGGPGTTSLTDTDPTAIETGQYDGTGCDKTLSWVHLKVVLDQNGVLNVYWKNTQIVTNLQTAYFPSPGRLLMASRVGGNTANIEIDNIAITTQPSLIALVGGAVGFPDGFSLQINDSGASVFDTNQPIELTLDGKTVTATSVLKSNNLTLVTYHGFPNLLVPGSSNTVTLSGLDTRGTNISGTSSFIAPVYATVGQSYAVTGVDTTKIGFKVWPYQTATPNSGPSSSFAEFQQAGLEGSNTANLTQTIDGFTGVDSTGAYTITDPVNWATLDSFAFNGSAGSFNSGNGFPDIEFPGMPPANGDQENDEYDNLSERVLTYLYLPAPGVYQMGVDSASGFLVTAGRNPADALGLIVGDHEGGGQANQTFYFVVTKAGYYPFGLLYYNGTDAANAEWFTVVNGVRYLINDLTSTNTTGIVGYYSGPALPAYVSTVLESPLQLTIQLTDQGTTVTDSSIQLSVNGATVSPTVGKVSGVTTVNYTPPTALASGSSNTFTLTYTDSSGVTTTNVESFIAPSYTAIPASVAVTGVNTNNIGFKVKPVQNAGGGSTTIAWAESQIAGLDGTNYADLTQTIDGFTIDANGYYTITNPVNWDEVSLGSTDGDFNNNNGYPDIELPGMPGSEPNTTTATEAYQDLAEEVLTYMYFSAAGVYEMGVSSDDGFKVTSGVNPKDQLSSIDLGQFDGGRGWADTDFNILIPAPGFYPFRLLYYNGGGGANCEWFTWKNGVRYLINDPDPSNTTGIHAYYSGPSLPPYVSGVSGTPTNVVFDLAASPDGGTATVVGSSVQVLIDGYSGAIAIGTAANGDTSATFTVTNALGFAPGSTNAVTLIFTTSTGQKVTNSTSLVTPNWQTIPASMAVTSGVDTTKPGFKVKPYKSSNGTTIATAEEELAGLLGTNQANLTQVIDGFPIDANGYYTWTNVINWDEVAVGTNGNHDGHFQPPAYPDLEFPGMPVVGEASSNLVSGDWNNLEEEVLTFVSFPSAGFYTMGVNSDDGFNLSVGINPALYGTNGPAIVLGDFDGGRGSSDSDFSFYVQAAGTYRFRLLYFNGGGGANCEWTSIDPSTGFRYLVNDPSPTNTTGIHAYYSGPGVVTPPTGGTFNAPTVANGSITITWTGSGTLQQATSLSGPWVNTTPAPTGTSYTTTIGSGDLYFRLSP